MGVHFGAELLLVVVLIRGGHVCSGGLRRPAWLLEAVLAAAAAGLGRLGGVPALDSASL